MALSPLVSKTGIAVVIKESNMLEHGYDYALVARSHEQDKIVLIMRDKAISCMSLMQKYVSEEYEVKRLDKILSSKIQN
jgi:hypothetical protein